MRFNGSLYFAVLGAASAALAAIAFVRIDARVPPSESGVVVGALLGEAVILASLPVLFRIFRVDLTARPLLLRRRPSAAVREVKEPFAVRFVKGMPLLHRLASYIERRIEADVVRGGMKMDPYEFAARYSFYSVVFAMIFVPVSLVLAVSIYPVLLALAAVPAVILFTPSLTAKGSVS